MKKLLGLVLVLVTCGIGFGQQPSTNRKIALTFEKLPFMEPLGYWRPREVSNLILRTLEKDDIPAAGFVVAEKLEDKPNTYVVLDDWLQRGHTLGNMTWGNIDLNEVGHEDFLEHAVDGQKILRDLSRQKAYNYRFLRFPLLHEGNEPKKKKRVRKALDKGSYKIAHVTVKTSDWAFNFVYLENEQDAQAMEQLRSRYLEHVGRSLDYAERQSEAVFGRNVNHVLQLSAAITTARFLPDLIEMLKSRGYQFVTLAEALEDPAYATEEEYVGPLSLSFIDRVAATRGLPFDESAGELSRRELERYMDSQERPAPPEIP